MSLARSPRSVPPPLTLRLSKRGATNARPPGCRVASSVTPARSLEHVHEQVVAADLAKEPLVVPGLLVAPDRPVGETGGRESHRAGTRARWVTRGASRQARARGDGAASANPARRSGAIAREHLGERGAMHEVEVRGAASCRGERSPNRRRTDDPERVHWCSGSRAPRCTRSSAAARTPTSAVKQDDGVWPAAAPARTAIRGCSIFIMMMAQIAAGWTCCAEYHDNRPGLRRPRGGRRLQTRDAARAKGELICGIALS